MLRNYRFDSRGSVPGILARLAQNASFATIACAPAVGLASGSMGHRTEMARLAVCTLGRCPGGDAQAPADSGETRTRYVPGPRVDRHRAVYDVGRADAWNAGAAVVFDVFGIK